ncbi:MAG: hypothetical protein ACXW2E_01320 [Nitrososphaeraceae archaeon]
MKAMGALWLGFRVRPSSAKSKGNIMDIAQLLQIIPDSEKGPETTKLKQWFEREKTINGLVSMNVSLNIEDIFLDLPFSNKQKEFETLLTNEYIEQVAKSLNDSNTAIANGEYEQIENKVF